MDPTFPDNFHLVPNLTFLGKFIDKVNAQQLQWILDGADNQVLFSQVSGMVMGLRQHWLQQAWFNSCKNKCPWISLI